MTVFDRLHQGEHIDIRDADYQREAHGEIDRCDHLCWQLRQTDPAAKQRLVELENELFNGQIKDGTYLTPPMSVDCASQVTLGKNVYINHHVTMMSLGGVQIDDGAMLGPEVGLFTVNHESDNLRTIMTKLIHIEKGAWLGARVSVLPGVTIGQGAIVGTNSVVTKDIPPYTIAVGNPARVIRQLEH